MGVWPAQDFSCQVSGFSRKRLRVSEVVFWPARLVVGKMPRATEGVSLPACLGPKKAAADQRCGFTGTWGFLFASTSVALRGHYQKNLEKHFEMALQDNLPNKLMSLRLSLFFGLALIPEIAGKSGQRNLARRTLG